MFGKTWSHNTLRKYVVLFGTLFNNLYIKRQDSSGENIQTLKIPLSYGPKEKFLARLDGDPKLERKVGIVLPRMSFEMTSFDYDSSRKLNTLNKRYKQSTTDPDSVSYMYQPVPYNIGFTLYIMVKNAEDGTKIVEQILPYFTPEWTPTVELIPSIGGTFDLPIVLNSVQTEDSYEGNFETRRSIIWTLNFTMKGYLFGPVKTASLIKIAEIDARISNTANPVIANTSLANTIVVQSTPGLLANGSPTSNSSLTVDTSQIGADDNYGFIVEFTENI
jgi:hypothetical protein